jgi:hypothetical protein
MNIPTHRHTASALNLNVKLSYVCQGLGRLVGLI